MTLILEANINELHEGCARGHRRRRSISISVGCIVFKPGRIDLEKALKSLISEDWLKVCSSSHIVGMGGCRVYKISCCVDVKDQLAMEVWKARTSRNVED